MRDVSRTSRAPRRPRSTSFDVERVRRDDGLPNVVSVRPIAFLSSRAGCPTTRSRAARDAGTPTHPWRDGSPPGTVVFPLASTLTAQGGGFTPRWHERGTRLPCPYDPQAAPL